MTEDEKRAHVQRVHEAVVSLLTPLLGPGQLVAVTVLGLINTEDVEVVPVRAMAACSEDAAQTLEDLAPALLAGAIPIVRSYNKVEAIPEKH